MHYYKPIFLWRKLATLFSKSRTLPAKGQLPTKSRAQPSRTTKSDFFKNHEGFPTAKESLLYILMSRDACLVIFGK